MSASLKKIELTFSKLEEQFYFLIWKIKFTWRFVTSNSETRISNLRFWWKITKIKKCKSGLYYGYPRSLIIFSQFRARMFTIVFFALTHPSATFFALTHSLSSTFFALRHSSAMSDFEQTDNNLRTNRQQISTTKHFQNTIDQDEWRWQDIIFFKQREASRFLSTATRCFTYVWKIEPQNSL